ncbi:MAG: TraB/GumN family protein [Rhodobacteraceae bacterium]|nr:TraB/GumN family protein [Paracoccaceae bacterium]
MKDLLSKLAARLATIGGAIALAFSPGAQAQVAPDTPEVAAAEAANDNAERPSGPALWKVSDGDTTIYLFGTIHALPKDVDWFKGPLKEAFESSDTLVTEVLVDGQSPAQLQKTVIELGTLPEGQTLRDLLSPEQRTRYEAAIAKLGFPVATFDRFEPWYAAMMFSMVPLLQQGYAPDAGVEKVLSAANAPGKQVAELESIDQQLAMFDQLPQENQVSYLMEVIDGIDEIKPTIDQMVAEWLEGDADGLAVLMNEGMSDPVVIDRLLYQRNRTWAKWIDKRLEQPGTVFVAVGAGHLAGKDSVQADLEKMGLTVERIQ